MTEQNPTSYTTTAKILHWLMAVIIIIAWGIGFYSANFLSYADVNSNKGEIITLHKQIASTVMFLVVLRIVWRLTHKAPALPDTMSPLVQKAAEFGHLLLYVLMIAVPVSGWFYSSAAGYKVPVAGLFELPGLIAKQDDATMNFYGDIHFTLCFILAFTVAGHILMALKHQFIDKDNTINKMLFSKK